MDNWKIKTIEKVAKTDITLDDGLSYSKLCFSVPVEVGDIWAIKYKVGYPKCEQILTTKLLETGGKYE